MTRGKQVCLSFLPTRESRMFVCLLISAALLRARLIRFEVFTLHLVF
jgi:hypothetical protein